LEGVWVEVGVRVGVRVEVEVAIGVGVETIVGVEVGVGVGVRVGDRVGVGVGVAVKVGLRVGVEVEVAGKPTTSNEPLVLKVVPTNICTSYFPGNHSSGDKFDSVYPYPPEAPFQGMVSKEINSPSLNHKAVH